jgi:triacylglycerol lipase
MRKIFQALFAVLFFIFTCSSVRAGDKILDPVLFVHGYFADGNFTWSNLKEKLIKAGWPETYLYNPSFKDVLGCDPEHAGEIKEWVDYLRKNTLKDRIDIVTHSMGALNVRYYIKYMCGYQYINDVVMIAGANKGSIVACADLITCGAKSMCVSGKEDAWKENDYLLELNSCDQTPAENILYTSIWSSYDEIIVPQENSIIDGADNINLSEKAGHAGILFSDETFGYVKTALLGGGKNGNKPESEGCVPYKICGTGNDGDFPEDSDMPDIINDEIIQTDEHVEIIDTVGDSEKYDDAEPDICDEYFIEAVSYTEEFPDGHDEIISEVNDQDSENTVTSVPAKTAGCGCRMNSESSVDWSVLFIILSVFLMLFCRTRKEYLS